MNPAPAVRVRTRSQNRRRKKNPWPMVFLALGMTAVIGALGLLTYRGQQGQAAQRIAFEKQKAMLAEQAAREETERKWALAEAAELARANRMPEPEPTPLVFEPLRFEPESDPEPIPVNPNEQLLETLNQFGEQCETFQFLPASESQYEQLQSFARQLSLVKVHLLKIPTDEIDSKDRSTLTNKLAQWQQTMKTLLQQIATESPERLSRINTFAKREFESENLSDISNLQIVFYGFKFLSDEKRAELILKFDRKQIYLCVASVPEIESMNDESYRVFFVQIPETPSLKMRNSPGGGLIRVYSAELLDVLDPSDSGG